MIDLIASDYQLKLIKDLGSIKLNINAKQFHRRAVWQCPRCNNDFEASVSNVKTGKSSQCKNCAMQMKRKYHTKEDSAKAIRDSAERSKKTKRGMLGLLYSSQKRNSKKRKHPLPTYTIEQFVEFAYSLPKFEEIYNNWVLSDYIQDLRPSFDRIDSLKPYTLKNIQVMTWYENNLKGRNEGLKHKKLISIMLQNTVIFKAIKCELGSDIRIKLMLQSYIEEDLWTEH